ncbi:peptidase inhibitor family I36 protein [Streptomyces sp. TS71-3]|uniref:peptidase inhibitor family I36 protein n=1 Tax=Streptomyces sp. TS71-3 TaxID=2733862 RepID=UPI001B23E358|nr:peptidase inhibitor family I36 protein [Streptomyces sp. TS71-3]GHJ41969.1 hypothetical protein Sm713_75780 [Streptomyces sp. TS71-3]
MSLRTTLVRALRTVLTAALVSLALVTGTVGTASAQTATVPSARAATVPSAQPAAIQGDNSQASVDGVNGVPASGNGGDCPYLRVCLYTGANMTGTRFDLYVCRDYRLVQWNGIGSVWNNQSFGAAAVFMNREFTVLTTLKGPDANGTIFGFGAYDFSPIWYVRNC